MNEQAHFNSFHCLISFLSQHQGNLDENELLQRKAEIQKRLNEICGPALDSKRETEIIQYEPKSDVHWDFVMKEMVCSRL